MIIDISLPRSLHVCSWRSWSYKWLSQSMCSSQLTMPAKSILKTHTRTVSSTSTSWTERRRNSWIPYKRGWDYFLKCIWHILFYMQQYITVLLCECNFHPDAMLWIIHVLNGITEYNVGFGIPKYLPENTRRFCKQIDIQTWDMLLQLTCCGMDEPDDFRKLLDIPVPPSCCGKKEDACDPQNIYKRGCVAALEELFKAALTVLGGVALGIAVAEVKNTN